jgi:hypothetical protein
MKITADVARDLLALVEAGEASEDSRLLVEEFTRANPEFARERRSAGTPLTQPPAPPDREMETLRKTKEMVRLKSWLLGLAGALTLAPLAFVFQNGELRFVLFRDAPGAALGLWSTAAAGWVAYYVIARRVRAGGL